MVDSIVQISGLSKSFKLNGAVVQAVKNVDLDIRRGEVFSLLGPNGAGKTTTISMISGLLEPTQGDALIDGHSITREPLAAKQLLGVVPQEIALYPQLSARQNLEFFGRMYGMGGDLKRRVDEVLEFIDLTDRQHDKVETFSGGMKRRVNIAIGLLHRPQLIFMDEPTVGIDPQNRRRILDTVVRLKREMGMTVLYTSHLMEEVQAISDRVGIMDHGEIIALGTVGELIQRVGEEDRLVFNVGDQPVPESLCERLKTEVPTVTNAIYTRHMLTTENGGGDAQATNTDGIITVYATRGRKALPDIIGIANEMNVDILSVEVREPDLEAVFLHLTGRALRD